MLIRHSLQASKFTLSSNEHPNKMPFTGLMTWFDVPSDKPVGGAGGKKVVIPSEYGIPALQSLKGMAVNFDSLMMNKHVTTNKIGIIEDVTVGDVAENGGVPVYISGYLFAHDFPVEATQIKEEQEDLGFSYETIDTPVIDGVYGGEPVLIIAGDVVFSGAAILLAEKAAYTNTSLAAQADETTEMEGIEMDINEIITAVVSAIEAKYDLTAKADETVEVEGEKIDGVTEVKDEVAEVKAEEKTDETSEEVKEEVKDEVKVEVAAVEVNAETIELKAAAETLRFEVDTLKAELSSLKAEAEAVNKHEHKGFVFPTTLAAKYNLQAEADTYEGKIAAVDVRNDLSTDEKMALKFELRAAHLKANK